MIEGTLWLLEGWEDGRMGGWFGERRCLCGLGLIELDGDGDGMGE